MKKKLKMILKYVGVGVVMVILLFFIFTRYNPPIPIFLIASIMTFVSLVIVGRIIYIVYHKKSLKKRFFTLTRIIIASVMALLFLVPYLVSNFIRIPYEYFVEFTVVILIVFCGALALSMIKRPAIISKIDYRYGYYTITKNEYYISVFVIVYFVSTIGLSIYWMVFQSVFLAIVTSLFFILSWFLINIGLKKEYLLFRSL
ncbi:TPA: hypothetical protein DEP21_02650 [Patescibacteria group bacterium]|nr:hypothetical protein [Candidatus Gracilibacteria bacterium]